MLYKVVQTFELVDKILKCDYSNESYQEVLSCGTVWYNTGQLNSASKIIDISKNYIHFVNGK